jgi:hypothetical protein
MREPVSPLAPPSRDRGCRSGGAGSAQRMVPIVSQTAPVSSLIKPAPAHYDGLGVPPHSA